MIDLHSRIIYINCVSKLIKWRQNLNALKYTALFHHKMVAKNRIEMHSTKPWLFWPHQLLVMLCKFSQNTPCLKNVSPYRFSWITNTKIYLFLQLQPRIIEDDLLLKNDFSSFEGTVATFHGWCGQAQNSYAKFLPDFLYQKLFKSVHFY